MKPSGQSLFAFVRFWSRRWTGVGLGVDAQRGGDVMVLEAIHALAGAQPSVSVNDVACELGVDQSGASRMIARAQRLGLVARHSSARIGAAASVTVTAIGEELLEQAHLWQDEVVRTLTADWPQRDVEKLFVLMDRLVRSQTKLAPVRDRSLNHDDPDIPAALSCHSGLLLGADKPWPRKDNAPAANRLDSCYTTSTVGDCVAGNSKQVTRPAAAGTDDPFTGSSR